VGALDFGLVVDATVIMVENIFRHMVERSEHVKARPFLLRQPPWRDPACQQRSEPGHLLCRRDHHRQFLPLFT
jgi:hypothetical protein